MARPKTCRSEWTYGTDRYPNPPVHPSLINRKRFLWTLSNKVITLAPHFEAMKPGLSAGHQPLWSCRSLELATPCTCRRAGLRNYERRATQPWVLSSRPRSQGCHCPGHQWLCRLCHRSIAYGMFQYGLFVCYFLDFYVPSTAQAGHLRTKHTLTVTPYQVETCHQYK